MVQVLTLYEETPDSRLQAQFLPCIIGAVQRSSGYFFFAFRVLAGKFSTLLVADPDAIINRLSKETLEGFQQKTALYAAGLLRKVRFTCL